MVNIYPQNVPLHVDISDHTVGTYAASDPDLATHEHGELIYSFDSGNSDGCFTIDPVSAVVKVACYLDYDTSPTSYNLDILVNNHLICSLYS